jgi:hypothetical protein
VQFLAPVAGLTRVSLDGLRALGGLALALGLLALALFGQASDFVLGRLPGIFLALAVLFVGAAAGLLGLLAMLLLLDSAARGFFSLALAIELLLGETRLLLEHTAVDVGALGPHLDAHRAGPALGRADLDLALGLALECDLARARGRDFLGRAAVRAPKVRQELGLRLVADAIVGAADADAGLVELLEELVDRDLQDLGELGNRDVRHAGRSSS